MYNKCVCETHSRQSSAEKRWKFIQNGGLYKCQEQQSSSFGTGDTKKTSFVVPCKYPDYIATSQIYTGKRSWRLIVLVELLVCLPYVMLGITVEAINQLHEHM